MTEYRQYVFRMQNIWHGTCSCGFKLTANLQDVIQAVIDDHKKAHEGVSEIELSNARTEFFEAFSGLGHVGAGMADRLRRFHAAWSNLNVLKKKSGQVTIEATRPRVK